MHAKKRDCFYKLEEFWRPKTGGGELMVKGLDFGSRRFNCWNFETGLGEQIKRMFKIIDNNRQGNSLVGPLNRNLRNIPSKLYPSIV